MAEQEALAKAKYGNLSGRSRQGSIGKVETAQQHVVKSRSFVKFVGLIHDHAQLTGKGH